MQAKGAQRSADGSLVREPDSGAGRLGRPLKAIELALPFPAANV